MSEVLSPHLQDPFIDYHSSMPKSFIPSVGSPLYKNLSTSLEGRPDGLTSNGTSYDKSFQRTSRQGSPLSQSVVLTPTQARVTSDSPQTTPSRTGNKLSSPNRTSFLPEKALRHKGMKTLVLDLDETLVHSSLTTVANPDHIVELKDGVKFHIVTRPHLDEFLERMSKIYELVIYTAAEKEYAVAAIDKIDPKRYISYILHREHCILPRTGVGKDLSLIGRDLKNVVFIDNLEENFRRQRDNGLKIGDFYFDKTDDELKEFIPFLEYVAELDDIRPIRKVYHNYTFKGIGKVEKPKKEPQIETSQKSIMPGKEPAQEEDTNQQLSSTDDDATPSGKGQEQETRPDLFSTPNQKENKRYGERTEEHEKSDGQKGIDVRISSLKISKFRTEGENTPDSESVNLTYTPISSKDTPDRKEKTEERTILSKERISFTREKESGTLIESPVKDVKESDTFTQKGERSPLINDIYARILALETKLKSKASRMNNQSFDGYVDQD